MKQLIHNSFFDRNTKKGLDRYLSTLGFPPEYKLIPGPNKYHQYAVSGEDIPVEPTVEHEPMTVEIPVEKAKKPVKKAKKKVSAKKAKNGSAKNTRHSK